MEKKDIVFQIINWNALDYEYDCGEGEQLAYLIKLYGLTEDGTTVSANITNFTPFFFIRVNHKVDGLFLERIREFVIMRLPVAIRDGFVEAKIMKKKDFWGFQNGKKFNFVRFTFINHNTFKAVMRMFQKDVFIQGVHQKPTRYKLYESNIEPFIRFMHIKDISPSGWIKLPAAHIEANEHILPTNSKIDVNCEWRAVQKVDKDKIAPVVIASFDLECTSSHGDFPVACKDYKKVAYDLLQAHNEEKITTNNIIDELLLMFDHSTPGILSKVFVKDTAFNKGYLNTRLVRDKEDIMHILRGRVVYKNDKYSGVPKASKDEIMKTLTRKFGMYDGDHWTGMMPKLEGDQIIQIGTTIHKYGSTECFFKSIITLGSCSPIDGVDVTVCKSEQELLLKWRDLILKHDPDVLTGYNIFGFDFAYLYDRAKELGVQEKLCKIGRVLDKTCPYQEKMLASSALGENIMKYIDMDGRIIIDIMKVVQRDHKLDSYKLDNVANHFMHMNKHDVSPNDIFRLFKGSADDRRIIAEYCVQDCALCNKLIMKLEILANNMGMSNVCHVPLSFIFMRGQGVKIFSLVAKQCRNDDFLVPTIFKGKDDDVPQDEEGYEGAIVLDPKEGIYLNDPVSVLDYASLYPSSMISENLSHDCIVLDPKYDNLPGVEYLDITYDVYDYIDEKKTKVGEKVCRFVQFPNGEKGVIPRILIKLLKARKDTRKRIDYQTITTKSGEQYSGILDEGDSGYILKRVDGTIDTIAKDAVESIRPTYGEFEKAVLDGLQLAYKVTANSLYGQVGAKTSPVYLKEIAACTTATGRKMICMARDYMLQNYEGVEIIYGDSVTGDTPLILRTPERKIILKTIEETYGNRGWEAYPNFKPFTRGLSEKQQSFVNLEVWTNGKWARINRVIRHKTDKAIFRVSTQQGVIDVTEDHSLLDSNNKQIKPADCKVGHTRLLQSFPQAPNTLEGNKHQERVAYKLGSIWNFADMIPSDILNASENVQREFAFGAMISPLYAHGIKSKLAAQSLYYVMVNTFGVNKVQVLHDSGSYRVVVLEPIEGDIIRSIQTISHCKNTGDFVYDIETEDGRFHAGVGCLIVKNTDSLFVKFPINPNNEQLENKEKIKRAWDMGCHASDRFKKLIKPPHDLEMEKVMFPFILFSKKRYCAYKYEGANAKPKMNSMGIALKRRDNAPIVKHIYGGCLDIILNEQDIKKSIEFLKANLEELINGKVPLESLVITKSLRADYKDPEKIAHKVLAERMGERDPGNKPMVNDRIPFAYVQPKADAKKGEKLLQGDRIEHPDYIRAMKLKPDYEFYITNQIMKPVLQLYALTLESINGYNKGQEYFKEVEKKLIKEKEGDMKKVKDRWHDLREAEAKKLLFDPLLNKLSNKKNGFREITEFFNFTK